MPEKLTLDYIRALDMPPVIWYAVPIMLFLVLVEWVISIYQKRDLYDKKDFLANAGVGIGNLAVSAAVKLGVFVLFIFVYNLSTLRIPHTWWSYVLCYIGIDFGRYWAHRFGHEWSWLWATHVTHHSSTRFNFSTSFRLSWTQHVKVFFFLPLALVGFHPVVFFICNQLGVLYQFWLHTELIGKLPRWMNWFAYFFVTPSHHRVHHGTQEKYLDRNYGSTLIIWDRIFGTFQEEEEKPIYGITKPLKSYNPITINFHYWIEIFKNLRHARSFKDVYQILFGYPGTWQPKMVKVKVPDPNSKPQPKTRDEAERPSRESVNA